MDTLKLKRKTLRSAFTRIVNELNEIVKQKIKVTEEHGCLATFKLLSDKNDELLRLNENILNHLLESKDIKEDELLSETKIADEYSHKFEMIKLLFDQKTIAMNDDDLNSTHSVTKRRFKLPVLELKKFGGDTKDWLPFWGQFIKIHNDPDIDEADKFLYLVQATVPNSRARQLVESFPPSAGNYAKAIDCLKSRFGRDDLLVEYYVRELLKLTLAFNLKEKNSKLSTIYDRIETQLRSLETLGVTTEKYAAMLFPLVESCLSEEVLRAWQRNHRELMVDESGTKESRLENLMKFLKDEVENEDRIALALQGFSLKEYMPNSKVKKDIPTAAELFSGDRNHEMKTMRCAFCEKENHETKDCNTARKLDLNEIMTRLKKKGCCFKCLCVGHVSKFCRVRIPNCEKCHQRHHSIVCPKKRIVASSNTKDSTSEEQFNTLPNPTCSASVFLQTLVVILRGKNKDFPVRALLDTGSQKSYITKEAVERMKYDSVKERTLIHTLFGGIENSQKHLEYKIFVSDFKKNYHCTFDALDQEKICSEIPQVTTGFWSKELKDNGIHLTDQECLSSCASTKIHLLIGADIAGKLMTGKIVNLDCGLTAIETLLGWTLLGRSPNSSDAVNAMLVTNLLIKEYTISDMWRLETIGISDPAESKNKKEVHQDTLEYFKSTLKINDEGRYEVGLPWVLESSRLPDNRQIAEKRLISVQKRLVDSNRIHEYTEIFDKWQAEGIIEEVADKESNVHYLPHRPVFKEDSATTKTRPVFDASAHMKSAPSLNSCLETGPNLIELIPSLINRFREFEIGITSDIEKAFLQIGIREKDRDYLRFFWKNKNNELKIYRHRRVVFGINCSPFLLAATLNYHLEGAPKGLSDTAQILKNSFYVDNCVCSVRNVDQANKFIRDSEELMSSGKFNLRGWTSNVPLQAIPQSDNHSVITLLGINWNLEDDTLSGNINYPNETNLILTKRLLLSLTQSIFDPIGISSPVTIIPKFILQESWNLGLKWDDILPEDLSKRFVSWLKKIKHLSEVRIPRWLKLGQVAEEKVSIHVFCDASAKAYAACVFLRVETNNEVYIRFVQSRARVSPLKKLTIPRLELLACCIGARLYASIVEDIKVHNLKTFCWTDSSTALCWIQRDAPWGTFVWNRVQEIRTLTDISQWRHIPGKLNPADLPTRGCSAEQFLHSKWWEGPLWLLDNEQGWPQSTEVANEDLIDAERRKTVLSAHNHSASTNDWYCRSFSSHLKTVRMLAWIRRFCNKARKIKVSNDTTLSYSEIQESEKLLMLLIQRDVFDGPSDPRLQPLEVIMDGGGLLRVKTRTIYRQDTDDFRYPIILPGDHPAVMKMIMYKHTNLMHCGLQILIARLRENYWILKARKSIRKVLNSCVRCKRYNSKPVKLNLPPLPEDRVRDAGVFEVSGVDLTGPLFLKDGSKTWVALFTCAVYRAIHLELLSSLSTENFLLALRRFAARRGSPSVMYSDNGSNFIGTNRLFQRIDWKKIDEDGKVNHICWKFIPPSAPWWGGWWERLIALVKDLLKRVLGRASLTYEELNTVICDCEDIVNSRPITYISENDVIEPLTPSMFLREPRKDKNVDLDHLEASSISLRKRKQYRCKLQEDLKRRFRLEYLGRLKQKTKKIGNIHEFQVGEIVLVELPNQKRLNWPLARITKIFPGKDGFVRLVKLKTKNGEFLRPVQRLYALEMHAPAGDSLREKLTSKSPEVLEDQELHERIENSENLQEIEPIFDPPLNTRKKTRLGREVREPRRLDL